MQWAVWWRHRARFGVDRTMWHVNFTGNLFAPAGQSRPPYWRWNPAMRQALLNMPHLTPEKIGSIVRFLNAHEFEYWSGYPSVIHAAVLAAQEAGLKLGPPPRYIITGAETVLDMQRRDIEAFTGGRVIDQYGQSEGCGNASQCEHGLYHEDFEFCILECLDGTDGPEGRRGSVVCTGFANRVFPFLRYEVGDTATWVNKACPCGRESTALLGVHGRLEDYVVTPEGGRIMRFGYIFDNTPSIKECQVLQERLGAVKLRVVRRPEYDSKAESQLRDAVHRRISPKLDVEFEYVGEIAREPNGKFRGVRSLLRRDAP